MLLKKMTKHSLAILLLANMVCIFGMTQNLAQVVKNDKRQNKLSNEITMSWEELNISFREVVGCKPTGKCTKRFTSKMLADWLQNCDYRDPDRKGNPKFNAHDLAFLDLKFGNAFAVRLEKDNIWVYKGRDMSDEEGVAYQLKSKKYTTNPSLVSAFDEYNQLVEKFNQRNPLEVPISRIADRVFYDIATHGYTNENGEKVANAREWVDYFGPKVGLIPDAEQ
jgi:hypothetical protein